MSDAIAACGAEMPPAWSITATHCVSEALL
jgi:hypothetical protein